jgi:hypothetical protein
MELFDFHMTMEAEKDLSERIRIMRERIEEDVRANGELDRIKLELEKQEREEEQEEVRENLITRCTCSSRRTNYSTITRRM